MWKSAKPPGKSQSRAPDEMQAGAGRTWMPQGLSPAGLAANVIDGFKGCAPDLRAIELGEAAPVHGPAAPGGERLALGKPGRRR